MIGFTYAATPILTVVTTVVDDKAGYGRLSFNTHTKTNTQLVH